MKSNIDSENVKYVKSTGKIGISDIICFICAITLCVVPFIPFVDELDVVLGVVDGELAPVQTVVAHLTLMYSWYGYLTIPVAILVVLSTLKKNTPLRIVMLVSVVGVAGFLVILANRLVMKIFTGGLYEPAVGYYLLIAASAMVVVITLTKLMKENNKK